MPDESGRYTAFERDGFRRTVQRLQGEIQDLYLSDTIPWVVGYSGGKDSTASLQLIWSALGGLTPAQRTKRIYVISTDTMVENPIVSIWVQHSLKKMAEAAIAQQLPVEPHRLTPSADDSFWVNLVGRGYPAPRPKFRWCTSRLKINPSNTFISDVVDRNGEAILVLGSRRRESEKRKDVIEKFEGSTRNLLSRNSSAKLDRCWVYTPIVEWSNDDVWQYLMQVENPWGYTNKDLLGMYQGATADGECPLVVDTSTPSCGDSRFGCYVCTMVEQDKSMQAMIRNDEEKEWMLPLSELRNVFLDVKDDRKHRDFRRMNKSLTLFNGRLVHGPYTQSYRAQVLRAILRAQRDVRAHGPEAVQNIELVTLRELEKIRAIWVDEKHEIEDILPRIYQEETGESYPGQALDESQPFQPEDVLLLRDIARGASDSAELAIRNTTGAAPESAELHFQLVRELLHVEHQYRTSARRHGLYDVLDKTLEHGAFASAQEALDFALKREQTANGVRDADEIPVYGSAEFEEAP